MSDTQSTGCGQAAAVMNESCQTGPILAEVSAHRLAVGLGEAAQMLGVCKRTLERERDRGTLKCLRLGRHWKVRVGELHAYLRRLESAPK